MSLLSWPLTSPFSPGPSLGKDYSEETDKERFMGAQKEGAQCQALKYPSEQIDFGFSFC